MAFLQLCLWQHFGKLQVYVGFHIRYCLPKIILTKLIKKGTHLLLKDLQFFPQTYRSLARHDQVRRKIHKRVDQFQVRQVACRLFLARPAETKIDKFHQLNFRICIKCTSRAFGDAIQKR